MNLALIKQTNEEWNNFVASLTDEEKVALAELEEPIASNQLYYLSITKDWIRFDQTVNRLSKSFLYNQEIVPTIYNSYIERGLNEMAFGYINQVEQYLKETRETISAEVQPLINNAISMSLLLKLKESFGHIRNLPPGDIVRIIPDILNNKTQLSEFILDEIVQAGRIVIQKIHGIKQITHEDRYNDLLLAILRLRFPVWGWEITDQARSGSSPTGISAGEVDILITAAGNSITLFEALILSRKNKSLTQKHIKKITSYASFLDRYYMIIYYTGTPNRFNATWNNYKIDAAATPFPPKFTYNISKGFEDLSGKFVNVTSLRIAKSTHDSIEIFHIMVDLSR
jgi:hypothetical protein